MTVSCWYGGLGTRMSCHYQYCMSGAMNNVLSNGNHTNINNNTAPSSSLSIDAVAVAVAMSWVRHVYGIGRHGNNYKSPSSPSLCVPVLGDWVPLGMYHFFPFSLPLFVLVLVGSSISPVVNSIPYLYLIRTIHSDSSSNSSNANCHQSSICVKNIVIPIVGVVFIILLLSPLFLLLLLLCPVYDPVHVLYRRQRQQHGDD